MARSPVHQRPRVAIVATRAYPDLGGIESHLDHVVPELTGTGWDMQLLVTDRTGRLPEHEIVHEVPVRRFRAFPRNRDYYFSPGLFRAVLRGDFDVVHVHGVNTLAPPLAMAAAILSRTPFVVTFHSGGANTGLRRRLRATQWRLLGLLLRRAHTLIAVSNSEKATFDGVCGGRKIIAIPNGSSGMVAPPDVRVDPSLVLSIGRLERYKGHHLAIGALAHLPGTRLVVLGTGPYGAELRALADRLGVGDRVEITSVRPEDRAAMAARIAAAGAVVLLSDYEAHPVAVLEALSLGRPVVVRRNSGMVDLIERGLVDWVPDDADTATIAAAVDAARGVPDREVPVLPSWSDCVAEVRSVLAGALAEREAA